MSKKVANNPAIDPTLPKVELEIDGTTYYLCFTFGAIATAEANLRKAGISVNMLHALDLSSIDASKVVPLLYASLITHDPDISVVDVAKMVQLKNLGSIFEAITKAYAASLALPEDDAAPLDQVPEQK